MKHLVSEADRTSEKIFITVDDTVITKSKASTEIEKMSKQKYHVTGKNEWCHTLVAMHGKCGDLSIPLNFIPYIAQSVAEKDGDDFFTKNHLAYQLISSLNFVKECPTYLLMDKWYGSEKLIMDSLQLGIHSIVPIKSNRIVHPNGFRSTIKDYANSLDKNHFNLVTVKGKDYYTFRYEGHLKGIPNAAVVISYQVSGDELKDPMFLLSTDISLSDSEIIDFYLKRWDIETSFRYQKESFGLDQYQMRKFKGIKRFWYLIYLAHNYLTLKLFKSKEFSNLGSVIRSEKEGNFENTIRKICSLSQSGIGVEKIVSNLLKKPCKIGA